MYILLADDMEDGFHIFHILSYLIISYHVRLLSGNYFHWTGMYILLADDTEDGFHTDSDWNPLLYEYQQVAFNIIKMIIIIIMMVIIIIMIKRSEGPAAISRG